MSAAESRLSEAGLILPTPTSPVANYVPFVRTGAMVFVSGQVSIGPDGPMKGRLGAELDIATGQVAARLCGLNLLAQLKAACGGQLDRVTRVVKLGAFVNCTPEFGEIPQVANGCSDVMVTAFGDAGRHARSAVGSVNLPLGFAVEVDGVFEIA